MANKRKALEGHCLDLGYKFKVARRYLDKRTLNSLSVLEKLWRSIRDETERIRILFNPMSQLGKGIITECRNHLGKQWKLWTHVTDDTVHFVFNNCGGSDLSEKSAWPQY